MIGQLVAAPLLYAAYGLFLYVGARRQHGFACLLGILALHYGGVGLSLFVFTWPSWKSEFQDEFLRFARIWRYEPIWVLLGGLTFLAGHLVAFAIVKLRWFLGAWERGSDRSR